MQSLLRRLPQSRWIHLGALGVCIIAMAGALWLEHGAGLQPCPLCIFQRIGVIGAGVFFLLAGVHNPAMLGQRIYAALAGLAALLGGGVSVRHLWLQSLPPSEVPACGPGLDYMMDVFPLQEVIGMILSGSGSCAEVSWQFLGLTLPAWTLLVFIVLLAAALVQLFRPHA
jgi:disulfide bond formation protein DsbB